MAAKNDLQVQFCHQEKSAGVGVLIRTGRGAASSTASGGFIWHPCLEEMSPFQLQDLWISKRNLKAFSAAGQQADDHATEPIVNTAGCHFRQRLPRCSGPGRQNHMTRARPFFSSQPTFQPTQHPVASHACCWSSTSGTATPTRFTAHMQRTERRAGCKRLKGQAGQLRSTFHFSRHHPASRRLPGQPQA